MTATLTERPSAAETGPVSAEPADRPNWGLARLRAVVLLIGYMFVGAASAAIFDEFHVELVVAPVPVAMVGLALIGRRPLARVPAAIGAIALTVTVTVLAAGGSLDDVSAAFSSGVQGLLSTDWPSPASPELIGTVVAVIATACAISLELAGHRRFHLLPLAPLIGAYVGVVALSSPRGVEWLWLVLLGVVSTLFALLRDDGTVYDRLTSLRGERAMLVLLTIAITIVALITVPITLASRADPRRNDPPQQTAPVLDPIETTLALRDLDPSIDLHVLRSGTGTALPGRWRTAALENYDGRRWTPNLTIRPIGRTLGPVTGPVIDTTVTFLDQSLNLVPLPGAPVSLDVPVETDADRTIVRLVEQPEPDDEIGLRANVSPTTGDAIEVGIVPRLVDDSTSGFSELAGGLAGDGSPIDQLTQLETTMRDDFVLDPGVQGGGLQQALIDRFLRDTQRGNAEQFATSFTLLARSLGIEARVATGFVVDEPSATDSDGSLTLTSADATVWPEVQLTDGRWLAFDPVPLEAATDGAPPPPEPQVQTPAAPQPPIAPPPDPDNESTPTEEPASDGAASALSTVVGVAIRSAVAVSIVLLPFLIIAGTILGMKLRRRRRRLRADDPCQRIRGAWASATDVLVDAGMTIRASDTDAEIAAEGEPLIAASRHEVRRLATLASAATYGSPQQPGLLAEDATACLRSIDTALATSRTRWQRLRWRLSLRSLRPRTRSPVTA